MAHVLLAELADRDTAEIVKDLGEKAGTAVAVRYSEAFDKVYRRLERFPAIGSPRPKLGKQARICIVLPYLVVYDYSETGDFVTVLRILHGKRKITRRLLKDRSAERS